jgi:amino-acid N-acetyltransferase
MNSRDDGVPVVDALRLVPAAPALFPELLALLASCGLPGDDLEPHRLCGFVHALAGEALVGNAGLVCSVPGMGLLRSVAVAATWRGCGLGGRLLADREAWAATRGVCELFLIALDAQAAAFFAHHGYRPIARSAVPAALADLPEFTFLCGAECAAMGKHLG